MKSELSEVSKMLDENIGLLCEEIKLSKKDKKVIKAFVDKKKMDGKKLESTGKRLDGNWVGGMGIAQWENGKIVIPDVGGRSAQAVVRALKKEAPKSIISESVLSESTYAEAQIGRLNKRGKEKRTLIVKVYDDFGMSTKHLNLDMEVVRALSKAVKA